MTRHYGANTVEVTFTTRTLLRWADLTLRYQPLSSQGIQPVSYALDRALGFRASKETRAMLHELVQRIFTANSPAFNEGANYGNILENGDKPRASNFTPKLIEQSLDQLAASAQAGAFPTPPQIALECPTSSGGKFWRGFATKDFLFLSWGRTGTQGGAKRIQSEQCKASCPILELKERALGKIAKGYDINPDETKLP